MTDNRQSGKLAVILHADIAGSTALVRQDEQVAHKRIQETFRHFGDTVTKYHGTVRELRGDALLAEFARASDAVTAALAFQADQVDYLANLNDVIQPVVRVGISMGEVIIADDTITGEGVVLAQRLEQLSEPGGVVIQGAAYETIPGRFPFEYENLGEHEVKGFDEPIKVYSASLKRDSDIPQPSPVVRRTRNAIIAFASVAIIIAGIALMWFKPWEAREETVSVERVALPLPEKPSIAVLAFDNLSGDPEQEYLSDGISENIITELSRFSELFVIARQSSFSYKAKPVQVQQVGKELGVRYVLEGSVQTSEDKLRVSAQLIDATTGKHLWAERYDRTLEDMFLVQDDISRTIVATLTERIGVVEYERTKSAPPGSLSAYQNRRSGQVQWLLFTEEGNEQARQLYERARELDPGYADAYAGLTWVYVNGYRWGWIDTLSREESLALALEMARKAVDLAPHSHVAHWALANTLMQSGQLEQSIIEYERALKLNPNDAGLLVQSIESLVYVGRAQEAVEHAKNAIRLNPYHPDWYLWNLGWAQYFTEDYEAALASLMKMNKMPNLARRTLAAVYVRLGRLEEAQAVIAEFLENTPDYTLEMLQLNIGGKFRKADEDRYVDDVRKAGLPE